MAPSERRMATAEAVSGHVATGAVDPRERLHLRSAQALVPWGAGLDKRGTEQAGWHDEPDLSLAASWRGTS